MLDIFESFIENLLIMYIVQIINLESVQEMRFQDSWCMNKACVCACVCACVHVDGCIGTERFHRTELDLM